MRPARDPMDFRIDPLSPAALDLLKHWKGIDHSFPRDELPEGMHDLAHAGFVEVEPTSDHAGNEVLRCLITFDGNNAQIRVASGIYRQHKEVWDRHHANDSETAAMEAHADWGAFA